MKKLVSAVLITSGLLAFGDDVATLEAGLKSDIMTIVNQVNPIDSATGQRKYISFAFITDFHKCRRVEGDDAAADPVKTYWYGSAGCLTESEQSIRLLGSLATDAGLDAVIAGGDFATAPIIGDGTKVGLTEEEYTNEIWNVKAMFDQHVPATVPLFAIDGNHERSYSLNGADMHMSDDAWAYVLTNFNTSASVAHEHNVDVTYHRDLAAAKLGDNATGAYTGNSYHIDLRRLVASGGNNVRIACVSMYDGAAGANPAYRAYDAAQFYDASGNPYDAALTPENTVIGMVAHGTEEKLDGTMARAAAGTLMNGFMNGYTNPKAHTGPWNLGVQGKAFFGLVAGHLHFTNTKEITDPYDNLVNGDNTVRASAVSVASAYGVNYPATPQPSRPDVAGERGAWRVEVCPGAPALQDCFLNVMQVADNDCRSFHPVKRLEGDRVCGVLMAGRGVLFDKELQVLDGQFSLDLPEKCMLLVTDLAPGKWKAVSNGKTIKKTLKVTQDGHAVCLEAPAGTLTMIKE